MILNTNITNKLEELIPIYFEGIKQPDYNEIYKCNAVIHFQNTFDINAPDFSVMLDNSLSKTENLLTSRNYYPRAMIVRFAKDLQNETKQAFINLFDETQDITKRINSFKTFGIESINRLEPGKDLSSYQDDRAIAVYLSLKYPEKYFLYKSRMVSDFCKKLNIVLPKEEALLRYWKLADEIKAILQNNPLIASHLDTLPDSISRIANLNLLTQDYIWIISKTDNNQKTTVINKPENIHYWLYSPGHAASKWAELYSNKIMAIGWDELGDLRKYTDKESIKSKLQEISAEDIPGSKKNDSTACDDFLNKVTIGDIVIAKSRKRELIGYGIVASDYYFDENRAEYKNCRKVDWMAEGPWSTEFLLVQKTLTDVTKYKSDNPYYEKFSDELMAIIKGQYMSNRKKPVIEYPLNQILFGPPGTGKTYNSINHALAIIENKRMEQLESESEENREDVLKRYRSYVEAGQILFATFHQSMCYEDFIEGIKPIEVDYDLSYELKDGIFKIIAENALTNYKSAKSQSFKKTFDEVWINFLKPLNDDEPVKVKMKKSSFEISHVTDKTIFFDKDSGDSKHTLSINTLKAMYNEGVNNIIKGGLQPYYEPLLHELLKGAEQTKKEDLKNFVLIIDEINRGNVSQIFGELITLIEKDKRLGAGEELTVTLPYSKKKGFGVPSNLYIIGTMNTADRSVEALDTALRRRFTFIEMPPNYELSQLETEITEEITLVKILKTLNNRIEKLLDKDHLIGHSYFLNVDDLEGLKDVFQHNIIPLLQEYFYGDFAKIGLVLGEAFFEQEKITNNVRFAKYKHDAIDDLNARAVIKLKRYWKDGEFEQAIKELVNPN